MDVRGDQGSLVRRRKTIAPTISAGWSIRPLGGGLEIEAIATTG